LRHFGRRAAEGSRVELPRFKKSQTMDGMSFHQCGQGPALLLIHDVGMCAESWYQQITQLQSDYKIYAIDLPGHGASRELNVEYLNVSLEHYISAVEDFIDIEIKTELIICGYSFGALIAAEIARRREKTVGGVLLLNPVYRRKKSAIATVRKRANRLAKSPTLVGVGETLDRWFGVPPKKAMHKHLWMCYKWLNQNSVPGYAAAYKAFASVDGVSHETAKNIHVVTTYMTGELDPNSTPEMSQKLANIRESHEAVTVVGAGHMLPLTHPDEVSNNLLFLT
jgi:pimeloyl-ACP methyl ester carboxylesterase